MPHAGKTPFKRRKRIVFKTRHMRTYTSPLTIHPEPIFLEPTPQPPRDAIQPIAGILEAAGYDVVWPGSWQGTPYITVRHPLGEWIHVRCILEHPDKASVYERDYQRRRRADRDR